MLQILTVPMARAAVTNMKRFVDLGKEWHNEEWSYLVPDIAKFTSFDEAISYLEKYIEENDGGYGDRFSN